MDIIYLINLKTIYGMYPNNFNQLNILNKDDYSLKDAYIKIEGKWISEIGLMSNLNLADINKDLIFDCQEQQVLPAFIDSHTHLVFAGDRTPDLMLKIQGNSYLEIKKKGGGIQFSAKLLAESTFEDLFTQTKQRIDELIQLGSLGFEIKSGYGLTAENEIKILTVIQKLKNHYSLPIKATFLAAHILPSNFASTSEYINYLEINALPFIIENKLADALDLFCETGFFASSDIDTIYHHWAKINHLKFKLHTNQFTSIGGIEKAIEYQLLSIDHLEQLTENEINLIAQYYKGFCTILPTVSFYLNIPYAPASELIKRGVKLVLASDFNPGTSPSGNMFFVFALACLKMNVLPHHALACSTIMPAQALDLQDHYGSLLPGKTANLILLKKNMGIEHIPYYFSHLLIDKIMLNGKFI